jgi:AraC-like DNA-binding protein
VWQISGTPEAAPFLHRVLPDGCADLLFNLERARSAGGTPSYLIGPMSRAQVFPMKGPVDVVAVRLRPGAIGAFAGIPADRVLDDEAPMVELPRALHANIAQLADTTTFTARAALLAGICRARAASLNPPDPLIRHAVKQWSAAERALPAVSVLTRDIGLSERAFERRFIAQVGLTPVRYRRLARFRAVLRLHASGVEDWSELAAVTGFSDQSHLVRDCREFTGLTPTAWAADQARRAGFLQDGTVTAL